MPTEQTQITEQFVFDGVLGPVPALLLAVVLALAAAVLFSRERQSLGPRWALFLWGLRMTALAVALWMLIGPMQETVHRVTTPQSVAILADSSESMGIVDPPEPTASIRWDLIYQGETEPSILSRADRAEVALGVAESSSNRFKKLLDEHRPARQLKLVVENIEIALRRAQQHAAAFAEQAADGREDLLQRIERVESLLAGPIAESMATLAASLAEGSNPAATDLTIQWELLHENLLAARQRTASLSRDLAQELATSSAQGVWESDRLSRSEKARLSLTSLEDTVLPDMGDEVRVRRFQFGSSTSPVAGDRAWPVVKEHAAPAESKSWAPSPPSETNLAEVLQQLSKERVSEATRLALLFSDGRHNSLESPPPQEVASSLYDLPLYVVPFGSYTVARDVRLHRVEAPSTIVQNDAAEIDAIVTAFDCEGLSTAILLEHNGQEIERKLLHFESDRIDRRVKFRVSTEELGWQDYELTVEPVEGESSVANNVAPVSWEVVRDQIRILLADGVSHWEYRYLQQLFRRDQHIECDELLFYPKLRGTGEMAANPRLPTKVDDWSVYDVVILGDVGRQQFSRTSQRALIEYIEQRQGYLIVVAGRDHMPAEYGEDPLMELLPVESSPKTLTAEAYSVVLTDEGRLHSALAIESSARASEQAWHHIYLRQPLHNLSRFSQAKDTARTLLRAVPTAQMDVVDPEVISDHLPAFLSWHQVGSGKVVYLAAPETYSLRFRRGDRLHHAFWGQMLRWITAVNLGSGSERVRLITDKTHYNLNDAIEVTVWLKDQTGRPLSGESIQASVRTLDETVATIELKADEAIAGRYSGMFEEVKPGAYEIAVLGDIVDDLMTAEEDGSVVRAMVTIEANENLEMMDTRGNPSLLKQLADITGGQVLPPTAVSEVLELATLAPQVTETVEREPLWNRWSNMVIVLGCLFTEWIVRKHKGLV